MNNFVFGNRLKEFFILVIGWGQIVSVPAIDTIRRGGLHCFIINRDRFLHPEEVDPFQTSSQLRSILCLVNVVVEVTLNFVVIRLTRYVCLQQIFFALLARNEAVFDVLVLARWITPQEFLLKLCCFFDALIEIL